METKLKPNAIGIPENKTIRVKTATITAINKGSINLYPLRQKV